MSQLDKVKQKEEELKAKLQNITEDLEKPETPPTPEPTSPSPEPAPQPEPSPEPETPEENKDEPENENKDTVVPETPPTPEPAKPPVTPQQKEEIDYKKKFTESSKEALRLYHSNVEVSKAIDQANSLPPPTDEELKAIYPEWDDMDEVQKRLTRDNYHSKKQFGLLAEAAKKNKNIEQWNEKVDKWVTDPAVLANHPELEGKEDDFRIFCVGKDTVGVNLEILASAFMHDYNKKRPAFKKGEMFPTGSGGANKRPKPKSDKISVSEGAALMKSNPRKWKELAQAGKIDFETVE